MKLLDGLLLAAVFCTSAFAAGSDSTEPSSTCDLPVSEIDLNLIIEQNNCYGSALDSSFHGDGILGATELHLQFSPSVTAATGTQIDYVSSAPGIEPATHSRSGLNLDSTGGPAATLNISNLAASVPLSNLLPGMRAQVVLPDGQMCSQLLTSSQTTQIKTRKYLVFDSVFPYSADGIQKIIGLKDQFDQSNTASSKLQILQLAFETYLQESWKAKWILKDIGIDASKALQLLLKNEKNKATRNAGRLEFPDFMSYPDGDIIVERLVESLKEIDFPFGPADQAAVQKWRFMPYTFSGGNLGAVNTQQQLISAASVVRAVSVTDCADAHGENCAPISKTKPLIASFHGHCSQILPFTAAQ